MDDDEVFNKKFHKYKSMVKIWENNFRKKRGRIPSKHDIREASKDIRYAYSRYYKMKTSFLEKTLNGALSDSGGEEDGFDVSYLSQNESNFSIAEFNISSQNLSQMIEAGNADADLGVEMLINNFDAAEEVKTNENAWGDHLNNPKEVEPTKEDLVQPVVKKTLKPTAQPLLKRNPRKTLSKRLQNSFSETSSLSGSQGESALPDLETILAEKSAKLEQEKKLSQSQHAATNIKALNEGWLNRCNSMNSLQHDRSTSELETSLVPSRSSYGISNISLSSQPSTSFGMSSLALSSSSQSFLLDSSKVSSENIYERTRDLASDDDIVANSEDESSINSSLHIRKKRRLSRIPSKIIKPVETASPVVEEEKIDAKEPSQPVVVDVKVKPTRTSRRVAVPVDYKGEDSNEGNEDPFASNGADSDKDPEFEMEKPKEKSKPEKKPKRIKKVVAKTKAVITKPKRALRTRTNKKGSVENEPEANEVPPIEEYIPEFGIENVQTTPRINIAELDANSQLFEKFLSEQGPSVAAGTAKDQWNTNKNREKLEGKMASGKLNENFVRLNIKKKVFVRGRKTFSYSRYKKTMWQKKKVGAMAGPEMDMGGCDGGILTCFECGGVGHFASQCKVKGDKLLELDAQMEDESPFPSLEEAASMAKTEARKVHGSHPTKLPESDNPTWKERDEEAMTIDPGWLDDDEEESIVSQLPTFIGHKIPEEILKKSGILEMTGVGENDKVQPLYKLNDEGGLNVAPSEVHEALKLFGHQSFRSGQESAIMRILSGQSTLVTLSTGSGKSLCYQLPAYLYGKKQNCCTLVISPLVSLMEDQVVGIPKFLNAQCLHTNQTPAIREKVMAIIKSGKLDVLLVSPEAIVSSEKSNGFGSILRQLPPIAFACIDEVHCVSQWSHNFRPSYLMICRVLKERLKIKTILGLTATATQQTRESIIRHLAIPDGVNGIISDIPLPDNLVLSISKDENRDQALITLLRSERLANCQSIIVYCTRRDECERIASFVRTCLQGNVKPLDDETVTKTKKRKRNINWNAEPYHAGMAASRRRTIQNAFMGGDLRIVVATVAFGMGINKSDIRAVIHYNMPKSFESYVQEVGRAGRDSKPAQCHLFLDSRGGDQNELRRHIFANSIDRHVIRKLLQKIFVPCACASRAEGNNLIETTSKTGRKCPGHEICFSIEQIVQELDIPEPNIATLLCYLELHETKYIQVLSNAYTMAKILSYGGPRSLKKAAQSCPPLAMAIALDLKKGISHDASTVIEFPVIEVASAIGWDSGIAKHQLKNLEWTKDNGFPKRSHITVTFSDLGFRVRAPGDLTDDELDETLDLLYERVSRQERAELIQLQSVFDGLSSIAFKSCLQATNEEKIIEPSNRLKSIIREYFQTELDFSKEIKPPLDNVRDEEIISDVYTLMSLYPENKFTGRSIARIFHGCQSPNFPAVIWSRCRFWRGHLKVDFNRIVTLSNAVIFKMRRMS